MSLADPPPNPVLVLGAHRSGTSALARVLSELGVYMGARLDQNCESTFYQRLNRRMEAEAGGHWTRPASVAEGIRAVDGIDQLAVPLRTYANGVSSVEYWGRKLRHRSKEARWGWKDPRNGLFLQVWRSVYPDLSAVIVRRHPAAAAISLHRRTQNIASGIAQLAGGSFVDRHWRIGGRAIRGRPILADSWRATTLRGAFEVMLEYAELYETLPERAIAPTIVLDYDDLARHPAAAIERVVDFLGLDVSAETVEAAASIMSTDSVERFRENEQLMILTQGYAERLRALGYDPL